MTASDPDAPDAEPGDRDPGRHLPALSEAEAAWRLDERKAVALSKALAGIPKQFQGSPGDLLAVWATADELGIGRMAMLRGCLVVGGKVQLDSDLMMAVALKQNVRVSESVEGCGLDLTATCTAVLPNGEKVTATQTATFTIIETKKGMLSGDSDPRKYPLEMLQMRARGFCLRAAIPDLLAGVYLEGDLTAQWAAPSVFRNITPSEPPQDADPDTNWAAEAARLEAVLEEARGPDEVRTLWDSHKAEIDDLKKARADLYEELKAAATEIARLYEDDDDD